MMAKIIFLSAEGDAQEVDAPEGCSVLDIAHRNGIDIEGACEGQMACSTCHVIVDPAWISKLPAPCEEEEELLDLVTGLTQTSRLGCQLTMIEALNGLTLQLPHRKSNLIFED
tara:strand:+ start:75 stop:413 length:339 start_codon:yes stop_codon:yes gene_type:complete